VQLDVFLVVLEVFTLMALSTVSLFYTCDGISWWVQ